MAWLWVKTESGEDIASFEITSEETWAAAPGLGNAVVHALEIEERERAKRAEYKARRATHAERHHGD